MKELKGDLLDLAMQGEFDVIVHGCNCFCNMGAGIAKTIKTQFPEAFAVDKTTLPADLTKLGTYSKACIQRSNKEFVIINAYTQFDWRGKGLKADYVAIRNVFAKIRDEFPGLRIGYPLIGAGLAGGDWESIASIIDEELFDMDHTLVRFDVL
ncbi:macro domain-containing protein [Undibacterium sp. Ji50W]|uniref:macro domain-containing protein n=1 Tax=Undibacterium sp. Ji50W TaxID=3413041 RepID=UPI003BF2FB41